MNNTPLVDLLQIDLSPNEKRFQAAGFEIFPGNKGVCFRQFFKLRDFQPMLRMKLKKQGVGPIDQISVFYSEEEDSVKISVMNQNFFTEKSASSEEGKCLLWGVGLA